jgi:hypothetical protein
MNKNARIAFWADETGFWMSVNEGSLERPNWIVQDIPSGHLNLEMSEDKIQVKITPVVAEVKIDL